MIPCVYFKRPGSPRPEFFTSAESVDRALLIAACLRAYFRVLPWVADWRVLAHEPTSVERAMLAAGASVK